MALSIYFERHVKCHLIPGESLKRNRLITLFKLFECINRYFLSFFYSNTRSISEVDVHLCIYTLHSFAYVCIYVRRQRGRQACNKFKTSLYFLDRCETPDDFKYEFNQFFFLSLIHYPQFNFQNSINERILYTPKLQRHFCILPKALSK